MHWKDALRRAVRTFLQAFLGTLLFMWQGLNLTPGALPDWETGQRVLIAALIAGVIALISFTINVLEDNTPLPTLLKPPPSDRPPHHRREPFYG